MSERRKARKYANPGLKDIILHSSHSHKRFSSGLRFMPVACEASLKRWEKNIVLNSGYCAKRVEETPSDKDQCVAEKKTQKITFPICLSRMKTHQGKQIKNTWKMLILNKFLVLSRFISVLVYSWFCHKTPSVLGCHEEVVYLEFLAVVLCFRNWKT